jgi:hypothetical protein
MKHWNIPDRTNWDIFPNQGVINLIGEVDFERANADINYSGEASKMRDILEKLHEYYQGLAVTNVPKYDRFEDVQNTSNVLILSSLKQFLVVLHSIKEWWSVQFRTQSGSDYILKRESTGWRELNGKFNGILLPIDGIYLNLDGAIIICENHKAILEYISIVEKHWNDRLMQTWSSIVIRHMQISWLHVTTPATSLMAYKNSVPISSDMLVDGVKKKTDQLAN